MRSAPLPAAFLRSSPAQKRVRRSVCFALSSRNVWFIVRQTLTDPRYLKLAKLLVEYSTTLKKGDRILLDMIDVPDEFTIELIRAVRKVGAIPVVETRHTRVGREMLRGSSEKHAMQ